MSEADSEAGQLDPQSAAVLRALNATGVLPFCQFEAAEARERILALRAGRSVKSAFPMAEVSEQQVASHAGAFTVRILRPRARREGEAMAVVIYFHGGGYFAGGLDETDEMVRQIATVADAVVVNVEYSLSPEATFPVAINQGYAALEWAASHAAELGFDPERIVVAGDSAGGNMTAVLCLMAREQDGPAVRFQALVYPSLDLRADADYPSRRQFGAGGYVLSHEDIDWMLGLYFRDKAEGADWRASPLLAESLAGLPPALIVTADHDPLVNEGKLYADRLAQAGVPVEYAEFTGTFHGFVGYASALKVGARGLALVCDRIRQAIAP